MSDIIRETLKDIDQRTVYDCILLAEQVRRTVEEEGSLSAVVYRAGNEIGEIADNQLTIEIAKMILEVKING